MSINEFKEALATHGCVAFIHPAWPARDEYLVNVYQGSVCLHGCSVSLSELSKILQIMEENGFWKNDH